jgi:hypothetical protein
LRCALNGPLFQVCHANADAAMKASHVHAAPITRAAPR